jgi:hypothetical protein
MDWPGAKINLFYNLPIDIDVLGIFNTSLNLELSWNSNNYLKLYHGFFDISSNFMILFHRGD